jgi:aromatic-L-amino-acid/L-tryptophan decarboxylase
VLLARDRSTLHAAFGTDTISPYLQDADSPLDASLPAFADLGPGLTREFRGLRLWLPLHLHGVGAFRLALDEKLDLAEHAYQQLTADSRLEVPWKPELSTVAFRLRGPGGHDGNGGRSDSGQAADERNHRFLERILAPNRVLLSSTRIDGRFMVRLSVLSHRTHREHIDEALAIIRSAADDF